MSGTKKTHAEMKAPYEIERENRIKSNNDFLKKLNLRTIQFPGASSSHPQKTSLPNHPEEREVAVDPDYVAENEEMDDNDYDDNDNVDDETNEQDGAERRRADGVSDGLQVRTLTKYFEPPYFGWHFTGYCVCCGRS